MRISFTKVLIWFLYAAGIIINPLTILFLMQSGDYLAANMITLMFIFVAAMILLSEYGRFHDCMEGIKGGLIIFCLWFIFGLCYAYGKQTWSSVAGIIIRDIILLGIITLISMESKRLTIQRTDIIKTFLIYIYAFLLCLPFNDSIFIYSSSSIVVFRSIIALCISVFSSALKSVIEMHVTSWVHWNTMLIAYPLFAQFYCLLGILWIFFIYLFYIYKIKPISALWEEQDIFKLGDSDDEYDEQTVSDFRNAKLEFIPTPVDTESNEDNWNVKKIPAHDIINSAAPEIVVEAPKETEQPIHYSGFNDYSPQPLVDLPRESTYDYISTRYSNNETETIHTEKKGITYIFDDEELDIINSRN